ncbi:MAG: cobyrinate a,c-diamide synthase [Thermodesulfovibrionales bacterium]|nr:cobyrinate a,c-diamide synthase [Thermodesulfovibrionales bacterium]
MRALIIAGTHSGCGKTTIAMGLMAACKSKGLRVQPFKCGPDYIDAGHHRAITSIASRNLDLWMCGENYVKECFYEHSKRADISIIEGVMGLYDGKEGTSTLAKLLEVPIVLVIDAYGMAESVGPIVKGFKDWSDEASVDLRGIIFNRVGSEKHFLRLKKSIKSNVEVLGYLPRSHDLIIPHRHLGLIVAEENSVKPHNIEKLIEVVSKNIDIDALITISEIKESKSYFPINTPFKDRWLQPLKKIALAYDKAFCFYYEDNLDILRDFYGEIIPFSPIADSSLPAGIDAIYLGGGYPELFARELSNNRSLLKEIYDWSQSEMPLYAECGGLMYLSEGIYDLEGEFHRMVGVFPFKTFIRVNRSPSLGYREVTLKEDIFIAPKGSILRGHEFHYSDIKDRSKIVNIKKIYSVKDNGGNILGDEGFLYKKTFASYIHLHFGSNWEIIKRFLIQQRGDQRNASGY